MIVAPPTDLMEGQVMKYKIIILAILSVFLCNSSYSGEELYTWKDKQGGIHYTEQRPPDGAEILDISPINHWQR